MKAVAGERRRFGYRRVHVMLERQGITMNLKKLRRLYREEGLRVRRRGGRKRALDTRRPMVVPDGPNQRWSLDFVSDAFTDGRRFRLLAVVDDHTRECLALVADTSLSGARVVRELDAIIAARGRPATIVSDNGTELTSTAVLAWCQRTMVDWRPPWTSDRWRPHGEPSRRESRPRTPPSRASMDGSGTSCSTRRCSAISAMPGPRSGHGGRTTTPVARIRPWATSRQPSSPRRSDWTRKPRSAQKPNPRLSPQPEESRGPGQPATSYTEDRTHPRTPDRAHFNPPKPVPAAA